MNRLRWPSVEAGHIRFGGILLVSEGLSRGLSLLAQIAAARILAPAQFGQLTTALVTVGALWILIELGQDRVLIVRTAQELTRARELLTAATAMRTVLSVVLLLVVVVLVGADLLPATAVPVVIAAAAYTLIRAGRESAIGRLRAVSDLFLNSLQSVLVLAFIVITAHDTTSALVSYVAANVATLIIGTVAGLIRFGLPTSTSLRALWRGAPWLWLTNAILLLYTQADVLLLASLGPSISAVGLYRSLSQLQVAFAIPAQVLATIVLPIIAAPSNGRRHPGLRVASSLAAVGTVPMLLLAFGSASLLTLVYGAEYSMAALLGPPLGVACMLSYVNVGLIALSMRYSLERAVLLSAGLAALVDIGVGALFVPSVGMVATAVARMLAEATMAASLFVAVRRFLT